MIKQTGVVLITNDEIIATGFVFDGDQPEADLVEWIFTRLSSILRDAVCNDITFTCPPSERGE